MNAPSPTPPEPAPSLDPAHAPAPAPSRSPFLNERSFRKLPPPASPGAVAFAGVFGILLPAAAFALDAALHVNPIAWGGPPLAALAAGSTLEVGLRPVLVLSLAALSVLGLLLHLALAPRRPRADLIALPLLGTGVLLSLAHAVAFVPLLPLSVVLIAFLGIGLLGLSPYLALWAYTAAFARAFGAVARLLGGRPAPVLALALASLLPIAAAAAPLLHARAVLDDMRRGGPAEITRGMRRLGPLAAALRGEIVACYVTLDAGSQVRLRALYMDRFGRDIHEDVRGRLTRARD